MMFKKQICCVDSNIPEWTVYCKQCNVEIVKTNKVRRYPPDGEGHGGIEYPIFRCPNCGVEDTAYRVKNSPFRWEYNW